MRSRQQPQRSLERQIARLERRLLALQQLSNRFVQVRLAVFVTGLAAGATAYLTVDPRLLLPLLGLTALLFSLLVNRHRRVLTSSQRHAVWRDLKQTQLARLALDWTRLPPAGAPPAGPDHPYARDLDLLGPYSLHRLVSVAATTGGHERLRAWLVNPAPELAPMLERQQLVRELGRRRRFRERLTLSARLASGSNGGSEVAALQAWLNRPTAAPGRWPLSRWLWLLGSLALINWVLFGLAAAGVAPPLWPVSLGLYLFLYLSQTGRLSPSFREAARLQDALRQLAGLFQQLERDSYPDTPALRRLCDPFLGLASRPSTALRRISRVVNATGVGQNPLVWLALNLAGPWDFYFALRLSAEKRAVAGLLPGWLHVLYEIEAAGSLANLTYLYADFHFPHLRPPHDGSDGQPAYPGERPALVATAISHPLIPPERRVGNDFSLPAPGSIALITGSNMSGKSTFLRTVGTNLVLAYTGGPVCGQLDTIIFDLFASARVNDSVTDGISYFYAEVRRLRALLDALASARPERPVLYLIDELFRGTNNRERLLGSEALVKALAHLPGCGLIATHDLELIRLATETTSIRNYHFRDDVAGDTMTFDYQLRPGPSPTTNALKIMRAAGLPVPDTQLDPAGD